MQLINKFYEGICFLLCAIDIFSIYAWVVLLKDKKGVTITNALKEILDEANCKASKIWVDEGRKLYIRIMESWLQDDDIEMYSIHSKKKPVVSEALNISEYNNTYHRTIEIKPADVTLADLK